METWIIYVIAPIAIALVSWILGKNGRRIDETSKLVALLQEEITRLTAKVEKLEAKVEIKEHESERKSGIIQELRTSAHNPVGVTKALQQSICVIIGCYAFLLRVPRLRSPEVHSVGFEYRREGLPVFFRIPAK